jgi:hypothetical protein
MLGLDLVPYLNRHVSIEGGRPAVDEIPDEQRALIAEHNRLDAELYRFGLELFEDAVAASDEGFAADVERLRALSADANEDAIQTAREWLDRELPPGTSRPAAALRLEAKAAGVPIAALKQVLGLLDLKAGTNDGDAEKILTRTEEADGDGHTAPGAASSNAGGVR